MKNMFERDLLEKQLKSFLRKCKEDELSPNTLKKYTNNITPFILFLDQKKINKDTIISFKDYLEEQNFEISTKNNYIVSINKFLKFINKKKLIIKQIKSQRKDSAQEYLEYTDYHRLLRVSSNRAKYKAHMLMRVLAETGIRVSELQYFILENLDTTMRIWNKGKFRDISIDPKLISALRKYARENKIYKGPLFPGRDKNKTLSDSAVRKLLKSISGYAKVKVDKVFPHSFRHYFAKRYLDAHPGDISGLAEILGHSSLETTRIYLKMSNKEKSEKVRKVKF